jgi:putative heme-binding domain-containing protein
LLERLVEKYGETVKPQAASLYRALSVDPAKQRARLEELVTKTQDGDVGRGHVVFNSAKAACRECHEMGYLGGDVGPGLSRVGGVRTERDLLEAIVFPNASFVRSYEPVVVVTREGAVHNGVIREENPHEVFLSTGAKERVRVLRDDVLEMRASSVSVMPSGLDQQLSLQELADLVAFLKAAK